MNSCPRLANRRTFTVQLARRRQVLSNSHRGSHPWRTHWFHLPFACSCRSGAIALTPNSDLRQCRHFGRYQVQSRRGMTTAAMRARRHMSAPTQAACDRFSAATTRNRLCATPHRRAFAGPSFASGRASRCYKTRYKTPTPRLKFSNDFNPIWRDRRFPAVRTSSSRRAVVR